MHHVSQRTEANHKLLKSPQSGSKVVIMALTEFCLKTFLCLKTHLWLPVLPFPTLLLRLSGLTIDDKDHLSLVAVLVGSWYVRSQTKCWRGRNVLAVLQSPEYLRMCSCCFCVFVQFWAPLCAPYFHNLSGWSSLPPLSMVSLDHIALNQINYGNSLDMCTMNAMYQKFVRQFQFSVCILYN